MEPETTEILWCLTRRKDGTIGMMFSKEGVIQALKRGDVFPFEEYQRSHAATPEMLELAARKRRRGRPKSLRTVSMHLSIVDRYYTFRREGKTQEEARELIRKQFRLKGSPRTIDQAISDWGDAIEELLAEESWERMLAVAEVQEGMSEEELERTIEAFHASDYCDECYRYKYQHLDNGETFQRWPMAALLLRRPEVTARTGLPGTSLYRLISQNRFPRPIKIGARAVGWRADEIEQWIAERSRERDGAIAQSRV